MRPNLGAEKAHRHLDLRGKMCPFLILELRTALNEMAVGEVLEFVTDFYPVRQTIPQHAQELGCSYELVEAEEPTTRFLIRKG